MLSAATRIPTGCSFDPAGHIYRIDGGRVPSVTGILKSHGIGPDYSAVPQSTLQAAAARGRRVHRAIELYHMREAWQAIIVDDERATAMFVQYRRALRDTGMRIVGCERQVYSVRSMFGGTLDLEAYVFGDRGVCDIKTTVAKDDEYVALQTAGYKIARNEQEPDRPVAKRFGLFLWEDRYELEEYDDPTDEIRFAAMRRAA